MALLELVGSSAPTRMNAAAVPRGLSQASWQATDRRLAETSSPAPAIPYETEWRQPPEPVLRRVGLSRWTDDGRAVRQHVAPEASDHVTIEIALKPCEGSLWNAGRCLHDGRIAAGTVQVTGPSVAAKAQFRSASDALHLFVPVQLLDRLQGDCDPDWRIGIRCLERPVLDPVVERLAWSLLKVCEFEGGAAELFLDGISTAVVARLLSFSRTRALAPPSKWEGLVKWRLKRVTDMIDARLEDPLTLADLAACAGLSRMHFAAQFRAATGVRPHEYLVRARLERAQELLRDSLMPLAEVALAVGFQTQAHFTTVFRRQFDETPGRWRQLHRSLAPPQTGARGEGEEESLLSPRKTAGAR